jgi:hypothetical protein
LQKGMGWMMGWWRICLTLIRLACAAKANPAATKPKIMNTSTQKISLPVLISLFLCFSLWPSSPRIWHPSNRKIAQALHSRTLPASLLTGKLRKSGDWGSKASVPNSTNRAYFLSRLSFEAFHWSSRQASSRDAAAAAMACLGMRREARGAERERERAKPPQQ